MVFKSAGGWDSSWFAPRQWLLVLPPSYYTCKKKGHQEFTHCLVLVYLVLSVPSLLVTFPADHLTAILITGEDTSQVCCRWWSHVNYDKTEPTKPSHPFRNSWSLKDFRPSHLLLWAPNSQVWVPGMWNTKVCTGLPECKSWYLSWQYVF